MLIIPFWLGVIVSGHLSMATVSLFATWMLGYFTFNAASLWLKSHRQARYRKPLTTYAGLTALAGLGCLLLSGASLLGWAVAYTPLTAAALALAAHRHERATIGGLLTVAAACLMGVTAAFPAPLSALAADSAPVWRSSGLAFAYFFGTVPYVKTLIRHRGHVDWVIGSLAYHGAVTVAVAVAAAFGTLSWAWVWFFALLTLRAGLVPALGPMRGRKITPKAAGLGEVAGSLILVALVALVG